MMHVSSPGPRSRWEEWLALLRRAPRLVVLGAVVLLTFSGFVARLWYLQFVRGGYYEVQAREQRLRLVAIPAPRGLIYDRNGEPLVRNVPSFNVAVVPGYLPEDEEEERAVLARLAWLLDMPYSSAQASLRADQGGPGLREMVDAVRDVAPYRPCIVKRGVDRDTALLLLQEALVMPGVRVDVVARREYPTSALTAQLVGYMLPIPEERAEELRAAGYDPAVDRIGVAGVEATYEEWLSGKKGQKYIEEDVVGREIRVVGEAVEPVPGHNVYLTLDLELQQVAQDALERMMAEDQANSRRGVVIAMNPQTGEILAMVSLPAYDNNLFSQGVSAQDLQRLNEDIHRPQVNHAISDELPPGSTFKIVPAIAALQEGVLTPRTRLHCPGIIYIPDQYFPNDPRRAKPFVCWNRAGHGDLEIVGGIAHSCDIFFYKVGGGFEETDFEGVGARRMAAYARLFGMGELTGIELPGEAPGLVPDPEWKRATYGQSWTTGDSYIMAIGQGFLLVTPLQLLNATAVVANGGTLYRPQVVHHITDAKGNLVRSFSPQIIRTLPITPENWTLVQQGMEGAVAWGTAPRAQVAGVRVVGKTGTAEFCDDVAIQTGVCQEGMTLPAHAWFTAFAPVEAPEIALVVWIWNGGEGSITAVPVAREILTYYFSRDEAGTQLP